MSWEKAGGEGRWTEYINSDTGESSIKTHVPRIIEQWCMPGKHYFEITSLNLREAECKKCGYTAKFVLGMHKIEKGKIVPIK